MASEDDLAEPDEEMQRELSKLVSVARISGLTRLTFWNGSSRSMFVTLARVLTRGKFVERRRRALAAYDEVTMGVDRHHELEMLADALGVPSHQGRQPRQSVRITDGPTDAKVRHLGDARAVGLFEIVPLIGPGSGPAVLKHEPPAAPTPRRRGVPGPPGRCRSTPGHRVWLTRRHV